MTPAANVPTGGVPSDGIVAFLATAGLPVPGIRVFAPRLLPMRRPIQAMGFRITEPSDFRLTYLRTYLSTGSPNIRLTGNVHTVPAVVSDVCFRSLARPDSQHIGVLITLTERHP
jgi:hypothetical protein